MTTPHIQAVRGDFAPTCLLPGDPLRAKYIAETYLSNIRCVNQVRGMLGFTGEYQGQPLSVLGSGMGIPSTSIYATELVREFGVKNLIRVGSCGAIQPQLKLGDIIIAQGAGTDSNVNRQRVSGCDFPATADFHLNLALSQSAERLNQPVTFGNIFSVDLFYSENQVLFQQMQQMGILAVEMEAAGLFGLAARYGAKAACVLTVSDQIIHHQHLSPEQRQQGLDDMIKLVLNTVNHF